jgi:DNA replication and repair protein RecF
LRVVQLSLTDFRNYASAEVGFSPGPNLIVGRNGQGKTNLVESIGYLSTLGSHRISTDQALIRSGAESAVVRTRVAHAERELLVELQLNRSGTNRAQVNRSPIRPRELPRYVSSITFAPEDLSLVRGDPAVRRRFADDLLVQRNPRLSSVLADYDRVVKQRNTLLKTARNSGVRGGQLTTLELWDEKLVAYGSEIIASRARLVARLSAPLEAAYRTVVDADHSPRLDVRSTVFGQATDDDTDAEAGPVPRVDAEDQEAVAAAFRGALDRVRGKELDRGLTLVGPHRDDILFGLNSLPAKGYASHGESWSFALALRLASAQLIRQESVSGDPILILDDVFAELDQSRRGRLADGIGDFEQVLITAAVLDDIPESLRAGNIRIDSGRVLDD